MMDRLLKMTMLGVTLIILASCVQHEMEDNARLKPFEPDAFFADGSSARPLVKGTVARGHLKNQSPFYTGVEGEQFVKYCPISVDRKMLERGQERFNIYCAVCHSQTGDGNGMVVQRGFPPPPSLHTDRLRQLPVGYFFRVMSKGSRKMPSYNDVLNEKDRWAVAAYIRTLQRSRHADLKEAPEKVRKKLESLEEEDTGPVYETGKTGESFKKGLEKKE